jgi:hypothetical protein
MRAAQGKGMYTGARDEDVNTNDQTPSIPSPTSIDAYMTRPETASRLYRVALKKLAEDGCFTNQEMDALWFVEPSAGTGNFFKEMPKDRRIGIDINPLAPDIIKADFLTYELPFDPSIRWGIVGSFPFSKGMRFKFIDRAARLGASFFASILPHTILRPSMINKIDPYFERIHHEVLPEDSFFRDGQVKYLPTVFQVWVRRDTPREPIIEQTVHPDWEWLPRKRMAEATVWMQNYGQGVGDIKTSDNLGRTNSPDWHWFIRCEPDVLARLRAIDWSKVALPTASTPTLTKGDVVRAYIESIRQAITTQFTAEPPGSWEPIGPFLRYGLDVLPDQPASSVIPSTSSPPHEAAQKFTNADAQTDQYYNGSEPRYIYYDDPYNSFGGSIRICKSPQTARFIANVRVPLDFDLGAHLEAMFGPETDR